MSTLATLDKPLTIIEKKAGVIRSFQWKEIWAYRELLYFMVWRDIKVRYKQTVLGVAWSLLQPLTTMLLFTLTFSKWAKIPSDGIPYPLFSYLGVISWNFFAASSRNGVNSITSSGGLISKIYFPRILCPCAAVAATLVDFGIALVFLIPLMIHYSVSISIGSMILFFLIVFMIGLLGLGLGFWLGPVNVRFRDIAQVLPFAFQIWMYATPIIYPLSIVPEQYRMWLKLNPMVGFVEAIRSTLLGLPLNLFLLQWAMMVTLITVVGGAIFFQKNESSFADYLG